MSIKVFIVDNHKMMCEGLRSLLENESDIETVGEAYDGREAINIITELEPSPDIIIMDIEMSGLNGIAATQILRRRIPSLKILVLSMYADRRFVTSALRAGALGYVAKDCTSEDLVKAIRAVASGQAYLSPGITNIVVSDYLEHTAADSFSTKLTTRETEVLQLIAEGKAVKQISSILCVSPKTIDAHLRHIMTKLNTHSIADLTKYAIRTGIAFF